MCATIEKHWGKLTVTAWLAYFDLGNGPMVILTIAGPAALRPI